MDQITDPLGTSTTVWILEFHSLRSAERLYCTMFLTAGHSRNPSAGALVDTCGQAMVMFE